MSKKTKKLKIKNIIKLCFVLIFFVVIIIKLLTLNNFKVNLKTDTYYIGKEFNYEFTATYKGKDVTKDVRVDHNTYNNQIGTYEITFIYTYNNKEYKVSKNIKIKDNESPVINLKSGTNLTIILGNKYEELGYEAIDSYDGDITDKVKVNGTVNENEEGTYIIKYQVEDSSGNKAMAKRTVTVTKKSPLSMDVKEFNLNGFFTNVLLKETEEASEEYVNETIFVGDSTALYYVMNKVITGKQLWHKEGIDLEKIFTQNIYINHIDSKMTLLQAIEKNKPKRILLTLGTNSVSTMEIDYFIQNYEKLLTEIQRLSPNTTIIVQSIFPVTKQYDDNGKKLNNDKINKMNYKLLEVCGKLNIPYLNTSEMLKDEDGALKEEYSRNEKSTPGVHLSIEGNKVAMDYFKNHVYKN